MSTWVGCGAHFRTWPYCSPGNFPCLAVPAVVRCWAVQHALLPGVDSVDLLISIVQKGAPGSTVEKDWESW